MLRLFTRIASACSVLAVVGSLSPAWGQVCCYDPCCCPCPRPVVQQCYQTIPVTEYRKVKQVVQRPICETKIIEQPCTEYRTVCENKVAQVPTCTYQPVTEYRTVQRDCGRWVTNYRCRPEVSPCQYDGRPDLFGFLNRTGYSVRMAFTPRVWAERTYVPNVVCQQIPVTRHVAVQGTRTVNYQVSRVVPFTTTRKVAVNNVRMVAETIEVNQPITVMRTVPMGTGLAFGGPYAPGGYSFNGAAPTPIRTGLNPAPDRISRTDPDGTRVKVNPKPAMERGVELRKPAAGGEEAPIDAFDPTNKAGASVEPTDDSKVERVMPATHSEDPRAATGSAVSVQAQRVSPGMFVAHSARKPVVKNTAVRWVARRKSVKPAQAIETAQGPILSPEVLVTENIRHAAKP